MNGHRACDAISVSDIEKNFGRGRRVSKALDGFSLNIPQGSVYGLLGANGAGKSTLLRIIAGLVRPDRGSVRLGRDEVPELIRTLTQSNIRIYEAKWVKPDLESVFLAETRGDPA